MRSQAESPVVWMCAVEPGGARIALDSPRVVKEVGAGAPVDWGGDVALWGGGLGLDRHHIQGRSADRDVVCSTDRLLRDLADPEDEDEQTGGQQLPHHENHPKHQVARLSQVVAQVSLMGQTCGRFGCNLYDSQL